MAEERLSPAVQAGAHLLRLVRGRLVEPLAHVLRELIYAWIMALKISASSGRRSGGM